MICEYSHNTTPDWLLVYRYDEEKLYLVLVNTGFHSEVLDM